MQARYRETLERVYYYCVADLEIDKLHHPPRFGVSPTIFHTKQVSNMRIPLFISPLFRPFQQIPFDLPETRNKMLHDTKLIQFIII